MKEEKPEIPLKTILQNFLNHVENLEVAREQYNNGEGDDQYEKEFQELKAFSEELKNKDDFSCSEGDSEVNRKKNRYKDILPFNYSRVILSEYPEVTGSDYINANYIKGASGSNAYIASQGPLPHTVNDWWRMVVEKEVQVIVMACNEQEGGKHKCECYWSESETPTKQFGMYSITLLKSREICPDFLVRTMKLTWKVKDQDNEDIQESRTVCQFHYSAWPDHGIPTQVKPLLEMVRLVRDCQASETLPVLVHCSAGCGRTGSICVIDYVWGLLKTGKLSPDFSLYNLVQDMRRQRIAMVQTVDQYMLCHRAVRELFLEQLRVIDSHPYENVGNDGRPLVDREKSLTPEYETIDYSKTNPDVDIDKVINARPKMGVGMLSREKSPSMIHINGETSENNSENGLPATLDEFRSVKSTPSGTPKIHEPPNPPQNQKESAAQRFKKGNLRLLQSEDGGWKLEELEERRKSLEAAAAKQEALENNNEKLEIPEVSVSKPPAPQIDARKDRRKKSSREEKSESALLRRPSMKKIKAFFDKDKNKENKDENSEVEARSDKVQDDTITSVAHKLAFSSEYASAVSKLPSLETSGGFFNFQSLNLPDDRAGLSKSVPTSLDRKQRYKDPDYAQVQGVEKTSNNNLSKLWPLKKENKATTTTTMSTKSVSSEKLQAGEKPALPIKRSKSMKSNSKPVSVIPVLNLSGGESSFSVEKMRDEEKCDHKSDEIIDLTKKEQQSSYHFGDKGSRDTIRSSSSAVSLGQPPPKPKRDWSSLASHHDYVNMNVAQEKQGRASTEQSHSRQGSGDQSGRSSDFLDQQMAKLKARKNQDESDSERVSLNSAMKRTKSGDNLSLSRNSEILDDDTRKILRDCQEYLLGASFESKDQDVSDGSSPGSQIRGRSAQSSPASSYNKYNPPQQRISGSHLSLSPPGSTAKIGQRRTSDNSYTSPSRNKDVVSTKNLENEYNSYHSDISESSPLSETGPSSIEEQRSNPYENISKNTSSYIDARGKINSATNVRNRERRNSFRQAVVDKLDNNGRPYEQIWFRGAETFDEPTVERDHVDGPVYANTNSGQLETREARGDTRQLRKSDSGSVRSQSGHIRSGSYDNIPGPNTTQAIFTLDPNPTAYEIINFQQPHPQQNSKGGDHRKVYQEKGNSGLQSVGLVAEACRDYERSSQTKQVLTKQNSGGNIRAPPPYQNPPGPPGSANFKQGGHLVTPPKHLSPSYNATRFNEPSNQADSGTPKRPTSSKPGPPPPYPSSSNTDSARKYDNRTRPIPPQQSTPVLSEPLSARPSRASRDDTELTRRQKNMRRNSSLVANARLSMGDFILSTTGLQIKPEKQSVKTVVVAGGAPGNVVTGARTAVMMGGVSVDTVPGVDLDRVAASMSEQSRDMSASVSSLPQPGAAGAKQLGRSIAGVITGIKSKFVNSMTGPLATRSSPSPPDTNKTAKIREVPIRVEQSGAGIMHSAGAGENSPHVIPLTVPGAEYGYPHRLEKRPLGPRETPNFQKKQEYL